MDWDELDEEEENVVALAMVATQDRRRKMWVHPINSERKVHDEFRHLTPQLRKDEDRFVTYFRMKKEEFHSLLEIIGPKLEYRIQLY